MTAVQIVFILIAAATLGAALLVVTTRNMVHAALWLIVALFGVAAVFVILSAGFLAVVQVVVYIGAIAILIIFSIMLTRKLAKDTGPQFNANWGWAALVAIIIFAGLAYTLSLWPGMGALPPALSERADPLRALGIALVSPEYYVLPFELASILLLAALIGSIVIAWERK